jgi:hypothetical protein
VASHTIGGQTWPSGTLVSVYSANALPASGDGTPVGVAVTSATVTGASVTFDGLSENVRYLAYAAGVGKRFLVPQVDPMDARSLRARVDELEGDTFPSVTGRVGGLVELNIRDHTTDVFPNLLTDSTAGLNLAIAEASALAASRGVRYVRLGGFANAKLMVGALIHKPNVWLDLDGATLVRRANVSASMIRNVAAAYGTVTHQKITGGIFDPNGFGSSGNGNIVQLLYCDDIELDGVTVLHNGPGGDEAWAMMLGGRNGRVTNCQVIGGDAVFEDGIHLVHGQDWRISDNYVESGDDAIVCGGEAAAPADPIRRVVIANNAVKAEKGYALSLYVQNGLTGANRELTDIEVVNLTGRAGITRNGGMRIVDLNNSTYGAEQIKHVDVSQVSLEVGSTTHDDVGSPTGIQITSAADVKVEAKVAITDKTGAATGFQLCDVLLGSDVTLDRLRCDALQKRFGVAFEGTLRGTLRNSTLKGGSTVGPVWMSAARDVRLVGNKLLDIANTQPGVTVSGLLGTSTYGVIEDNTFAHVTANAARQQILADPANFAFLALRNNDFSADGSTDAAAISPAAFRQSSKTLIEANRGLSNKRYPGRRFAQIGEWAIPNIGWTFASGLVPAASNYRMVRYVPSEDILVAKIGLDVRTAATNNDSIDVGIYDAAGNRLVSSGATAGIVNGATGKQTVSITPTYLLAGTVYYLALAYGTVGGTAATLGNVTPQAAGVATMFGSGAGAVECSGPNAGATLPATATFALGSAQSFALAALES